MSVRFVGGPYDGHWQEVEPGEQRLTLNVSLDVFAYLEGRPAAGAPVTSVAVYEFDPVSHAYLFRGQGTVDGRR